MACASILSRNTHKHTYYIKKKTANNKVCEACPYFIPENQIVFITPFYIFSDMFTDSELRVFMLVHAFLI